MENITDRTAGVRGLFSKQKKARRASNSFPAIVPQSQGTSFDGASPTGAVPPPPPVSARLLTAQTSRTAAARHVLPPRPVLLLLHVPPQTLRASM